MGYRIAADLVLLLHFSFILFALFGGLFVLWRSWMLLVHPPTAVWIALVAVKGWICPLTPLENRFRALGGEAGYGGGFLEHYLVPVIYPDGLTSDLQLVLGLIAIGVNGFIYLLVVGKLRRRSQRKG
ncbi:MAG: DUF2784 domain-containing protein [Desulfuromonas sp.]|nr:MAG: DUF2784 domain-containing protein [Desulfuromonas sp.]